MIWVPLAAAGLIIAQVVLVVAMVHRESLTFDEEDHMYAGYMMWTTGDYGLNPEHPPLVKLLATLPLLYHKLWTPPMKGIFFKGEAFFGGERWLEHNDGGSQRLVFRMRMAAGILAISLTFLIFAASCEWFGASAGLFALAFAVFEPNLMAHSFLVTTDIGAALFFLAAIYAFYRYVTRRTWLRLVVAGLSVGLLLATKHSGILIAPILVLIAAWEAIFAPRGARVREALRLSGAGALIAGIGYVTLWAFYGFRYAARPAGLQLHPRLADYAQPLTPFQRGSVWWMARLHLLPESYMMGMVDIKVFLKNFTTFIFGQWHPHGLWWYFPAVFTIKSTLGLLAALALFVFALLAGKLQTDSPSNHRFDRDRIRPLVYLFIAGAVYLAAAMHSGLNIGVRHILPLYAFAVILAGAGLAALASRSRGWMAVALVLVAAHAASSLSAYPNSLAYENEAWGGPHNTYRNLSDSNVDWGQQLYQVKAWQTRHPGRECWFAYLVSGFIDFSDYGVTCKKLPNGLGVTGGDLAPPMIHGSVLLSATEVNGGLWPAIQMDPYARFQRVRPDEEIDDGVLVYSGDIPIPEVAGLSRAYLAMDLLQEKKMTDALKMAEEGAEISPGHLYVQWALGDVAAAAGKKDEARTAYEAALQEAQQLDPERREDYTKQIQDSMKKL
jgi:Dolichyl-phosphate-mannose-protein mannosyltransferase/Tetratricopeptide repeat-like domain